MPIFKAIIFDLGKVVFDLSFDRVFQSWAASCHHDAEEIKSRFAFDDVFDRFEKDEISAQEFRRTISKRLGLIITDEDFDKGWCGLYLDTYPRIDDMLIQLKANYKLVALTNTNLIHNSTWRTKYADTLLLFEKIFSSPDMKIRKPEPQAYKMVLDYLQCNPAEAIFLDDNPINTDGAAQLGIVTVLVTSPEQMKDELRKFGVLL